jgi:hypothetical protein
MGKQKAPNARRANFEEGGVHTVRRSDEECSAGKRRLRRRSWGVFATPSTFITMSSHAMFNTGNNSIRWEKPLRLLSWSIKPAGRKNLKIVRDRRIRNMAAVSGDLLFGGARNAATNLS